MNRISFIPEKRKNRFILLAVLLTILSLETIWVFNPQILGITGFATYEEANTLILNKTYYNNSEEIIDIISQIDSLSIDANLIGNGEAVIWLEYNDTRLLVARLQSKDKETSNNLITGLVVEENIVENNTEEINTTGNEISEPTIIEPLLEQEINNAQENVTEENMTEYMMEEEIIIENNTAENMTINTTEETIETNTTTIEENMTENITENTTTEETIETTFTNECIDSCIMEGVPPYKLIIELSNVTLYIEKLNYKIKREPIIQVETIPNMTLDANNNSSTLNLSGYFNSTKTLSYDISNIETQALDVSINGELLHIVLKDFNMTENIDAYIYATDGENTIISNIFTISALGGIVNASNISIETIQYPARINERVKWVKKITSIEQESELNITLPLDAENITVTKRTRDDTLSKEDIVKEIRVKENKSKKDNGLDVDKKQKGKEIIRVSSEENAEEDTEQPTLITESFIPIEVNETIENVEIEYYTDAPTATETTINENVKEVIVSSEMHYNNVLSYANLSTETDSDKWIKIIWIINNTENITDITLSGINITDEELEILSNNGTIEKEIPFKSYDTNSNELIDYIEWVAPHLSGQKFIIIVITKADMLDENRTFIKSIYEYVKEQDDIWFNVSENNYVRVTFEKPLTSTNDITIYARAKSEDTKVIVYEEGQNISIAEFTNLTEEKYHKIYLTSLNTTSDTFDLKIVNGTVEIDHIIDPTPIYSVNFTMATYYQNNAPLHSIEGARGMQYDSRGYLIISSNTDDSFTIIDINNPESLSVIGSINNSALPGSVDGIWFGTLDDTRKIFYAPALTDDQFSIYNISPATPTLMNNSGTIANNSAGYYSIDGVYDVAYADIGASRYAYVSASVDDTLSVYNVTNPLTRPVGLYFRNATANPCSTDELRKLYVIPGTTILLGASTTDDTVSVFNISANGNITCLTNYTDKVSPVSVDGLQNFYFESSTKLLYVPSQTDGDLTILNLTGTINSGTNITTVGSVAGITNAVSVAIGQLPNNGNKFAFVGTTVSNATIRIINVTDPTSPTLFATFNVTGLAGTCTGNGGFYSMYVKDNYLFATSSTDACLYSIKWYNTTYITPQNVTARISPAIPDTSINLQGYCNASDDDDIFYNYIWYKNGTINITGSTSQNYTEGIEFNIANISSSQLVIGQNWTFSCQANDTLNVSGWVNSSTVVIINSSPIMTLQPVSAQDPVEGSNNSVQFNFTVNDPNGNSTINVSSAIVRVNYSGIVRQSNGCTGYAINATAQNVSCNVSMRYYDPFGIWNINITIRDNDNNYAQNLSTTFTYNELSAIQINTNNIDIGTVTIGQQNVGLTPIIVNNTGNSLFVNLSIKAIELRNTTYTIYANNFTVNVTNSASGQSLINNTYINITSSGLDKNNDTTIRNVTLYIYLDLPSTPLVAGYYKSISDWIIVANK